MEALKEMIIVPEGQPQSNRIGMFVVRTANQCIDESSKLPKPKCYFNGLIYEEDLTIIFAEPGAGKSLLAVQEADTISRNENEKVLYIDFELSDKQFDARYETESGEYYRFHDNLLRINVDFFVDPPPGMDDESHLMKSLEDTIVSTGAKIVFIDNLTFLKSEIEKGKEALSIMRGLKKIQRRYQLTIVVLAHTPKRDRSRPLTMNDLAGSRNLANGCDAMFAIGISSTDPAIRYIKQFKSRWEVLKYTQDNVIIYQLEKRPDGFLGFTWLEYGNELNYIKEETIMDRKERDEQIMILHRAGKSNGAIGRELKISTMTVGQIIKKSECYSVIPNN